MPNSICIESEVLGKSVGGTTKILVLTSVLAFGAGLGGGAGAVRAAPGQERGPALDAGGPATADGMPTGPTVAMTGVARQTPSRASASAASPQGCEVLWLFVCQARP